MNCASCGHANPDHAKFCLACGSPMAARCTNCATPLPPAARFCLECGTPVTGAESHAAKRVPRSYTPKHLADKILQSRSAIEGERKQVTVLFADVKGSTELAEQLDPEEWHAILERFFEILTEGVHRFEGTVNQYTGDGIMALFGAPIAHEDHAQRACYAALQLRDELRRFADTLRLEHGLELTTRMGLNSGEVVVGKIGDDLRMDYTAQGQVVNIAQRMEQLAVSGRVYLAQQTADRVSGYFRLREIGPTQIKGVQGRVRVYELEDVGELHGRFDVARARGLTKFVGREREMAQLEAALERGLGGRCQFVGIVAEAGTGKSRLVHEFSERCRRRGMQLVTAGCQPHGKNVPLGMAMDTSRSLVGVLESDDRETARRKVADAMSRADASLIKDIPIMLDVLGLAEAGSEAVLLDPETRMREYLRISAILGPKTNYQVMILEDLHWIDAATEAIMVPLSRIDLPNPRLKVFTYRPEHHPAEADWPEYEEMRLKPFSSETTAELLRDLLGEDASVQGLEDLIQERAVGNPFFVEEIVQSLVESGQLEGERGARRLVRAIDQVEVPNSVQALLASRIDRLDEQAKAVLHAASVIGLEFPIADVEQLTTVTRRDLDAAVQTLTRAEFVYQLTAYPEVEYKFKHPLIQQVAYDTQLREPRRRVHAKIAHLLERRHHDKLDEKAGLIAYHWQEAAEPAEAARWYARAAAWLESRDVAEALRHWRLTRSLLGAGARSVESNERVIVACRQILNMGWRQGLSEDEAASVFTEGRELARADGDTRAQAVFLDAFATYRITRGRDDGLEYNRQALEVAQTLDDPPLLLELEVRRAFHLLYAGRPRESLSLAKRAQTRISDLGLHDLRASNGFHLDSQLRLVVGVSVHWLGHPMEARTGLEESLSLARRYGDVDQESYAQGFLTECCIALGDLDAALSYAHEGVKAAEKNNSPLSGAFAYGSVGRALIAHGRPAEAVAALEQALAIARDQRTGLHGEADYVQLLAEARLGIGEIERALETCRQAIEVARRNGTPLFECDAQLVLARILLRGTVTESAVVGEIAAALDRAEALIDQIGAESRRPRLLELRAEFAKQQGDATGRERFLREARRLLTEMGATARAERLERELVA